MGGLKVPRRVAQAVTLTCPARPQLQPLTLDHPIIFCVLIANRVSSQVAWRKGIWHEMSAVALCEMRSGDGVRLQASLPRRHHRRRRRRGELLLTLFGKGSSRSLSSCPYLDSCRQLGCRAPVFMRPLKSHEGAYGASDVWQRLNSAIEPGSFQSNTCKKKKKEQAGRHKQQSTSTGTGVTAGPRQYLL